MSLLECIQKSSTYSSFTYLQGLQRYGSSITQVQFVLLALKQSALRAREWPRRRGRPRFQLLCFKIFLVFRTFPLMIVSSTQRWACDTNRIKRIWTYPNPTEPAIFCLRVAVYDSSFFEGRWGSWNCLGFRLEWDRVCGVFRLLSWAGWFFGFLSVLFC